MKLSEISGVLLISRSIANSTLISELAVAAQQLFLRKENFAYWMRMLATVKMLLLISVMMVALSSPGIFAFCRWRR